jgi:hypothetical protein
MMRQYHKGLLDYVSQNKPSWGGDKLETFGDEQRKLIERYAVSKYWSDSESINIQDIAGTAHPDYAERTWLYLLSNGKRMATVNLPLLESNPGYYYEAVGKKPNMEYVRIDGTTYIMEGNHRTCIARFLFYYQGLAVLHGVALEQYTIDHGFRTAYETLEKVLRRSRLSVERTALSRQDTGGWYRENYELKAALELSEGGAVKLSTEDMIGIIAESGKPLKRFFGKYKYIWRGLL